jgi:hypothetical protein
MDRNNDGTCVTGYKPSPVDERFCIPEAPGDGADTDGDGEPDSSDGCPDGWSWNINEKRCVIEIEITGGREAKPVTIFDICKQDPKFLTPTTIAYCKANTSEQKEKDGSIVDKALEPLAKYFKEGTKALEVSKVDIASLYSGLFKPMEALIARQPQCPIFQGINLPSTSLWGVDIDFQKLVPDEGINLPCDMLAFLRIMFLLGVTFFGFRLLFNALVH